MGLTTQNKHLRYSRIQFCHHKLRTFRGLRTDYIYNALSQYFCVGEPVIRLALAEDPINAPYDYWASDERWCHDVAKKAIQTKPVEVNRPDIQIQLELD